VAANPIKTNEIVKNEGDVRKLIKELRQAREELMLLKEAALDEAAAMELALKQTGNIGAGNKKQIAEAAKHADEVDRRLNKINESMKQGAVEIAGLKNAQTDMNRLNKLSAKLLAAKEGSYNKLSAQYSINKMELNGLSAAERKNTAEGKKLVKETNAIYQEMKRLQEETGKHVLSVGDYTKSIREAGKNQQQLVKELDETRAAFKKMASEQGASLEDTEMFTRGIAELETQIESLGSVTGKTADDVRKDLKDMEGGSSEFGDALEGAIPGAGALRVALQLLAKTPVLAVLLAVVAVGGALFGAFTKSKRGAELMAKAGGALEAVMSLLVKGADILADLLIDVWNDPIGSIEKLRDAIRDNITNRIEGLIKLFPALRDVIKDAFNPFKSAKESGAELVSVLAQISTGLDKEDQENLAAGAKALAEELERQAVAFMDLETAKREQRRTNRALATSVAELTTAQELAQAQADDDTKSFKEREEASERARKANERRAAAEVEMAKGNLALINRELDMRRANNEDVEDMLDQQLEGYRSVMDAERELLLSRQDNAAKTAKIEQDRLERDLDILIDGFDNQKTINERRIQDEANTLEKRRDILEETVGLANSSFAKQIEIVQSLTSAQLDANDLLAESDAVALNQKIRSLGLSEIIEGRLLEIIRDRRSANRDLIEANRELYEAEREQLMERSAAVREAEEIEFSAVRRTAVELADFRIAQKQDELDELEAMNAKYAGKLGKLEIATTRNQLRQMKAERTRAAEQSALEAYDREAALLDSQLELTNRGQRKITTDTLKAERDRLAKRLELNAKFTKDLTDQEIEELRNRIQKIDDDIKNGGGDYGSIWDVFGIDLPEGVKDSISQVVSMVTSSLNSIISARKEAAKAAYDQAEAESEAAASSLATEIENRDAGYSHKVETANKEFQEAQRRQRAALKEREKAQKAEARLQTAEQTVSLVTASANIWKSFTGSGLGIAGPILAIAALGLMWGSFAASKVKASQLAKEEYADGGFEVLKGGSHASGNDTPLGFKKNGKQATGERGEGHMILPAKVMRKNGGAGNIKQIYDSLQRGDFREKYQAIDDLHLTANGVYNLSGAEATDVSGVEAGIGELVKQGSREHYHEDGNGNTVRVYKNVKTTYV
jgi:hypothetical protein